MDAVGGVIREVYVDLLVKDLIQGEVGIRVLVCEALDDGLLAGQLLAENLLGRVNGLQQEGLDHEDAGLGAGLDGVQNGTVVHLELLVGGLYELKGVVMPHVVEFIQA